VRERYKLFAHQYRVPWRGRRYDPARWDSADIANRCISAATACLYGITEAAILAAGYAPAIGFLHTGKPLSFVYDVADIFKFETVVPAAFRVASRKPRNPERAVRQACRDAFRKERILKRLIPTMQEVLHAGELEPPQPPADAQPPALPEPEKLGDDGHRG
jgi:CRISPR-associated protein Cas1